MPHEFKLEKQIDLDATPEEVWEAIATGPGLESWFMGRNEVEPGVGGRTRLTIGGYTTESTITAWEPPNRIAQQADVSPDGTFMAIEYLVEGRGQGSAVLRMVHSGFLGDDWEAQYDALDKGWPMYLHKLAQYLVHFRGRTGRFVSAMRMKAADRERAMRTFRAGLGLPADAVPGDPVHLTPVGLAPIDGVFDYASEEMLGLRTDDAMLRFIHGMHDAVALGHHFYAPGVDVEELGRSWQAWLDRHFPAPA